jgi:hypothetical protein
MTERKQRCSFQGFKNAVTLMLKIGSNHDNKTAKTVCTVLKRYKTVVVFWRFAGQQDLDSLGAKSLPHILCL